MGGGLLANPVIIFHAFTLFKQSFHFLCHVDSEPCVPVTCYSRDEGEDNDFGDGVLGEVFFAEGLSAKIEFYDECAVEAAKDAQDDEEEDLLSTDYPKGPKSPEIEQIVSKELKEVATN
jgi:hypothetical protein